MKVDGGGLWAMMALKSPPPSLPKIKIKQETKKGDFEQRIGYDKRDGLHTHATTSTIYRLCFTENDGIFLQNGKNLTRQHPTGIQHEHSIRASRKPTIRR